MKDQDALQRLLREWHADDWRERKAFRIGFAWGAAVVTIICTALALLGVHNI